MNLFKIMKRGTDKAVDMYMSVSTQFKAGTVRINLGDHYLEMTREDAQRLAKQLIKVSEA